MDFQDFVPEIEDRFLRYARIDSQSDESSSTLPSTSIQLDILNLLSRELDAIGTDEVKIADYGCLFATIPATVSFAVPTVAFMAHVDTAPAFHAMGVKPIVHRRYDGQPIVLPDDPTQVLSPTEYPYLSKKIGEDIVIPIATPSTMNVVLSSAL